MEAKPLTSDPRWQRFREAMPVARRWAYFDHAAVAPLTAPCEAAIAAWLGEATGEGDTAWPRWSGAAEQTRARLARLIGAETAEIALVHNTTEGITLVAEGYPWQAGDNVVTLANEFPSNQYPWLNLESRGVETRRVEAPDGRADLERIDGACDARTRIISVSWVGYLSGWRADLNALAELAHRRGALVFVDAIQGLGVFPLDVRQTPIDFLAADGHKWLLGPEGAGMLYVRREHLDRLRPIGVGWHSVRHEADYGRIELVLKDSAARFEGGSQNMVGFIGLGASVELLLDLTPEAIGRRLLEITDRAIERLQNLGAVLASPRDADHRSGIIAFDLPGRNALDVKRHLLTAGVVTSARGGKLRLSPHAYTNDADLDRLCAALAS